MTYYLITPLDEEGVHIEQIEDIDDFFENVASPYCEFISDFPASEGRYMGGSNQAIIIKGEIVCPKRKVKMLKF